MTSQPIAARMATLVRVLTVNALLVSAALADPPTRGRPGSIPIPQDFTGFAVAMANGILASPDDLALTDPAVFEAFQRQVIGRTTEEIEAHRQAALQFFAERFGIHDAQTHPDVVFSSAVANPAYNYRIYAIGGLHVPASGWVLHDAGYTVVVTNPLGLTLGGEFAGVHVSQGALMAFGDYKIERLKRNGEPHPRPFHVAFKSAAPIFILEDGTSHFQCELDSAEFGTGLAQGFWWLTPDIPFPGLFQANQRIIWTFSEAPLNGL